VSVALSNAIVWNVAFYPRRGYLAGEHFGNVIQLWDLDPDHARQRICALTAGSLTRDTWHEYLPQLHYHPPCD
jgi:hypothetical protein